MEYIPFTYLIRFRPTGQVYYGSKYSLITEQHKINMRGPRGSNCASKPHGPMTDAHKAAKSKRFIIFKDGVRHDGVNLNQFCKDNGLGQAEMSKVCRGLTKTHKGWSGEYLT